MVFRVFSGIIGLVFFLVLVLVTFFSGGNSNLQALPVQTIQTGIFSVSGSGQLIGASQDAVTQDGFSFERLSSVDTIYFSPGSEYQRDGNRISLGTGEFIIAFESVGNNYEIVGNSFHIDTLEAGSLYINTKSEINHVLLSLDTLINIKLTDNNQDITYVDLYPHMYIRLNPNRLKFLKNADLVRISSVFDLGSHTGSIGEDISSFLVGVGIRSSDFFDSYLVYLDQKLQDNNKLFQEILSISGAEFPGVKSLKKYFYLFLNDTKKRAYYKNTIFNDLTRLVQSDKKETKIVEDIVSGLSTLKSHTDDYDDISELIEYFYSVVAFSSDYEYIFANINMQALMLAIKEKRLSGNQETLLSLSNLYQNYNTNENYSYENLSSFSQDYIVKSGLNNDNLTASQKQRFDYFSFFLSELFISRFSSSDENLKDFSRNDNFNSLLKVMSDYASINRAIYSSEDEKRAVTGIYVHADVLKKLGDFIRSALFSETRGENGVLIKSRRFQIDNKETTLFQKNIDMLLDFYGENKRFLSSQNQNDVSLSNTYGLLQSQFTEYFLALSDYESYLFNYDETKKNLFGIETFGQNDNKIIFSQEAALNYLRQFSKASLSDIDVKLREDFYEIENFVIDGKNFSFHLSPYDNHRIDNIVINNIPTSVSYKLDSVAFDWKKHLESARDEEDEQRYDFSRFFLNTFSESNVDSTEEIFEINRNDSGNNDKFIVVFKRDKLLGDSGEFSSLKGFLDISFSDIDVVQNQNLYDIFINDADLNLSYEGEKLSADFTSGYVLADDKHYFKNIKLSPYSSNLGIRKPDIGDNSIQIVGNINLVDLKDEMTIFTQNYSQIKYVYNSISKNLGEKEIGIRYLKSSQKLNFRFDYQGDFISILISGDTIENISQGGEVLLRDANYRTIDDILTTIKKQ